MTIKEVAAAAGVSPTTVSHVLNNRGRIAEQTRARVLEVVRQFDYQANAHAQQLVTRRSRIIAIQMPGPGLAGSPALPHSAYFLELINGAAAAADNLNYAVFVAPSGGKASMLNGFAIDGAIVVDPQGEEPVFASRATVVTVGVPLRSGHDTLSVDNDHARAAAEFRRICKPGGYVAITWNKRKTLGSPFLTAYDNLLVRYGTDYTKVAHERVALTLAEFDSLFGVAFTRASFDNAQHFGLEGLQPRCGSGQVHPLTLYDWRDQRCTLRFAELGVGRAKP